MKYDIVPYERVGNITFSMSRIEVRKIFDDKFKEFKKTPLSDTLTDDFGYCHVYYDREGMCEAIEFFDNVEVLFINNNLIHKPYCEIEYIFKIIDSDLKYNDAGFESIKYGIGVYAPFAKKEVTADIESIIVFRKGYYD